MTSSPAQTSDVPEAIQRLKGPPGPIGSLSTLGPFDLMCQACQPAGRSAGAESSPVTATLVAVTAVRSAAPSVMADHRRLRRLGGRGGEVSSSAGVGSGRLGSGIRPSRSSPSNSSGVGRDLGYFPVKSE